MSPGDTGQAHARELLRDLAKTLPCAWRVRLGSPLPGDHEAVSDAGFTGKSYVIRIRNGLGRLMVKDCIVHEYAHCRVWGRLQAMSYDHDPHWGVEYSRVYCEVNGVA